MGCDSPHFSVKDLIERGDLLVSDGYRAKSDQFLPNGIPFGRIPNVVGGFSFNGADLLPRHIVEPIKISKQGDVVFTSKGTVGRFALVRKDTPEFVYSPQLCFWRSLNKEIIDPNWLYYWMHSKEFFVQYKSVAGQTDMAEYVSLKDQRRMGITLPAISEQTRVAGILGAFDEKIELNRKMNETLEQMARALFKSWFVDFDPVHAKEAGCQPAGMDKATVDLFPDSLVDSELGKIPKGWRSGKISEEFSLTMGQSPSGESFNQESKGIPFYQGSTDFGFRFPTRRIFSTSPTRHAKEGDTLVSVRAPVGDINMANEDCCIGRGVAAIRHKTGARSFTYYATYNLKTHFSKFEAEGTVFGSINREGFENLPLIIPPEEVVAAFERIAKPIDEKILLLTKQSKNLTSIRDSLLPKMLSGETNTVA